MPRPILYSLREGIGLLRLNRPEVLNALNREVYGVLVRRLEQIAGDGRVRALVVASRGRAFCAGYAGSCRPVDAQADRPGRERPGNRLAASVLPRKQKPAGPAGGVFVAVCPVQTVTGRRRFAPLACSEYEGGLNS